MGILSNYETSLQASMQPLTPRQPNPDLPGSNNADKLGETQVGHLSARNGDDEETQCHPGVWPEAAAAKLNTQTALHNATSIEEVRLLIDAGADVLAIDVRNETRLHIAALDGETEVVQLLLDAGANVLAGNFYGATPLHMAVKNDHEDAARLLVNAGSDLALVTDRGETPLHWAADFRANVAIAKILIDAGANVSARDHDGETPLHKAAGNYKLVELLVDSGADVLAISNNGWTPLHSAAVIGCPKQAEFSSTLEPTLMRGQRRERLRCTLPRRNFGEKK